MNAVGGSGCDFSENVGVGGIENRGSVGSEIKGNCEVVPNISCEAGVEKFHNRACVDVSL